MSPVLPTVRPSAGDSGQISYSALKKLLVRDHFGSVAAPENVTPLPHLTLYPNRLQCKQQG